MKSFTASGFAFLDNNNFIILPFLKFQYANFFSRNYASLFQRNVKQFLLLICFGLINSIFCQFVIHSILFPVTSLSIASFFFWTTRQRQHQKRKEQLKNKLDQRSQYPWTEALEAAHENGTKDTDNFLVTVVV
jgi:Flp pilus assembly protein TadB